MCVGFPLSATVLIAPHGNHGSRRPVLRLRLLPLLVMAWLILTLVMAWETRTLRATAAPHTAVHVNKRPRLTGPNVAQTEQTLLGAPSHLEVKVRRASTQERYNTTVETFLFWCQSYFSLSQDYDSLLTAYLNELYAQGADVSVAEYTFAAFRYRFPDYGKYGSRTLARAIQMRLPTPRVAFAAIVGALFAIGNPVMALALLLQWDLLLRPGELTSLRPRQVVAPASLVAMPRWGIVLAPSTGGSDDPSKTNVFDESILLSPRVDYLLPALAALVASRKQMPFLFDFTCTQLNASFKDMADRLKLGALEATLYGNRHGGASELRLLGTPLKEIKARGRWQADSSLKRYEKATVAQQQVHKVPLGTQLYGNFVENQLKLCGNLLAKVVSSNSATALSQLRQLFLPLPNV
ncbi:unnamed protein product [Symbiodinium pilosum]|uniref:Uncharacterized protein n=1 Tax=Symbiodinium pilosum TaxID=2952 RepID=A0A812P0N4_SYMPI|nr:unnamed protein product [Symbiodinium pilosum]